MAAISRRREQTQEPGSGQGTGRGRDGRRWRRLLGGPARREAIYGLLFLAPWIVGFLLFCLGPVAASLYISFTDYSPLKAEHRFIGLDNWRRLFADREIWQSLSVTLRFLLFAVPLTQIFPLGLALLLGSEHVRFRRLYLTLIYLPVMVPVMAAGGIWQGLLNARSGWITQLLALMGVTSPSWLLESKLVLPFLALMGMWGIGHVVIVLMAGLQRVPRELYDAARVDGASRPRLFWSITLPLMSPLIFFNILMSVIGSFQYAAQFSIYGNSPGPDGEAYFYMTKFYKEGWALFDHGYASTMAWFLLLIVLAVTAVLLAVSRRLVYYDFQPPGA